MSTKRRQFHFWHLPCKKNCSIIYVINYNIIFRFFYDIFDENSKRYINNILISSTISLMPLMQSQTETVLSILLSTLEIIIFGQRGTKVSASKLIQICSIVVYFCLKILFNSKNFLPLLIMSFSSAFIIFVNAVKLYYSEIFMINKK